MDFGPPRKSYWIGRLFTHKKGCGGAISVTERGCTAPISILEHHVTDRFCAILCVVYAAHRGSNYRSEAWNPLRTGI